MTPPSEERFWPIPRFKPLVEPLSHYEETSNLLRAIMVAFELLLSQNAPHDVIYLDGSLTTPIIYFNQALNQVVKNSEHPLKERLLEILYLSLNAYNDILQSPRSDHIFCAFPKYSTLREIGQQFGWSTTFNDRAILTQVLNAGECTKATLVYSKAPWHLTIKPFERKDKFRNANKLAQKIIHALNNIYVLYYKPYDWTPAFRIELGTAVTQNKNRLAMLLQGTKHQCITPGIMEPYPLYLADRMVKHLGKVLPAIRQVATQNMVREYEGNIGGLFYTMHGYRTESGRG